MSDTPFRIGTRFTALNINKRIIIYDTYTHKYAAMDTYDCIVKTEWYPSIEKLMQIYINVTVDLF